MALNAICLKILLIARANNERVCIDLLMAAGADIDAQGHYERTPLITAVFDRHENVALALLEYGADIDLQDVNSWTALHFAIYQNVPVILDLLLQYKVSCAVKTKDCKTILHIATYLTSVNMELSDILLRAPLSEVDIQAKDRDGNTMIDIVVKWADMPLELRSAYGVLFDNVARLASRNAGRRSDEASEGLPEVETFLDAVEYLDDTEPV
ncbi:MAG: hypothetical protein M1839_001045 [Geoglossum umbratile]|nr:MAG: hypothetical protein M1839_001045 [Geoglossum umbratile]